MLTKGVAQVSALTAATALAELLSTGLEAGVACVEWHTAAAVPGFPPPLVALLQANTLRQTCITAVILDLQQTGTLLDEGATACCCYQACSLAKGAEVPTL